eukprot:scaffold6150_cov51-Attheya_sp.AAC.1
MSESALTKLRKGNVTLEDLPNVDVESTLWNVVKTHLSQTLLLTDDDIKSLVDAKKSSREIPASVTLKYGNRKAVTLKDIRSGEITVAFLTSQASFHWNVLEELAFELQAGKNQVINDDYLETCTFPLSLTIKADQLGFSEFISQEKALEYAGVKGKLQTRDAASLNFPPKLQIDDKDPVFLHACEDLKLKHDLYDPLEEGCEYTRREFISSILVLAATKAGVKLACEEMVEGSGAKGPVDWIAHYQDHGICITEGKNDQIATGIAQNLAQLTALGEKRGTKRDFKADLPLYGVATTYIEWIFIRLSPPGEAREAVRLPTKYATDKHQIKDVAECLAGLLLSQKQIVDEATGPPAKKVATCS